MKKLMATGMLLSLALLGASNPTLAADEKPNVVVQQPSVVDLNTATLEQLTSLKGIGQSKALAILEYRKTMGKFHHIEQLAEVKGIGMKMVERLEAQIKVED